MSIDDLLQNLMEQLEHYQKQAKPVKIEIGFDGREGVSMVEVVDEPA